MKAAIFCLLALTAVYGEGFTNRQLKQALPTLPATPPRAGATPPSTSSSAPAPGPLGRNTCALEYLVNAGNFNTLIELVEAASQSATIAQTLDSPASMVTLLAPTDAGIQTTLTALNLTADQVLAQPARISDILLYHVLPSQISTSDLVDGYSFNTGYTSNGAGQSVLVRGSGATATFVGRLSNATTAGTVATACNINIIPINGLLVPY